MEFENRKELVKYRLDDAGMLIVCANDNIESGRYKRSLSDSYYAMFSCARAILARDGVDFSKHAGVISYFQKNYIKTNIIDAKFSDYIRKAFQVRNNADYADFFIASRIDAEKQYSRAKEFYEMVCDYMSDYLKE